MSKKKPEDATAIEECLSGLIGMHNQFVKSNTGQGDAAAMATATCIVEVASALDIFGPEIDQLRSNLGLELVEPRKAKS